MATNSDITGAVGVPGGSPAPRIPVMIVDDQPETRLGLSLMVRRDPGLAVMFEAGDGRQAIDRIERAEQLGRDLPRVVLMDVRMPVLDGIDATAAITRRWPGVRVLILTTYDEDDYAFGGLEAGASGFLLKDVRAGELCRAVRSVADGDAVLTPRVTREVLARSVRASGRDARGRAARRVPPADRPRARGLRPRGRRPLQRRDRRAPRRPARERQARRHAHPRQAGPSRPHPDRRQVVSGGAVRRLLKAIGGAGVKERPRRSPRAPLVMDDSL